METLTKKRRTQSVSTGITTLQYEEALAKYATNHIRLKKLGAEMEEQITAIREEYDSDLNTAGKENELLLAVIKGYCVEHKQSLFGDRRSIETLFGKVGFRRNTPSLRCIKGFKWEDVLANLKQNLPTYVRTTEEPDKEQLLADRDKEGVADQLQSIGVTIVQEDKFFIDLKEEC